MKAYIELPDYPGTGKALRIESNNYVGVDIYDADGKEVEQCRYFPLGHYGSPKPVPAGLQSFFDREFPSDYTDWNKDQMVEWSEAASPDIDTDQNKEPLFNDMKAWAMANNYPVGE